MSRPRTNNPSNLPTAPNVTYDPVRQNELLDEFTNKLEYLTQSYALSVLFCTGEKGFNHSLIRLKRALARKRILKDIGKRLHPELELLLSVFARRYASAEGMNVSEVHIRIAGQIIIETIKPSQGRPDNPVLEFHVKGLMALVLEYSGLAVISQRDKNSVYNPQFPDGISQIIPIIVKTWDESITTTQLTNLVKKIRKEYAGKPMHFHEIILGYGITMENEKIVTPSGHTIEEIKPNIAVYCP